MTREKDLFVVEYGDRVVEMKQKYEDQRGVL